MKLLTTFAPYLKRKSQNPHATLLALFINAVHECSTVEDYLGDMKFEIERLNKYMPLDPKLFLGREASNADFLRYNDARSMFRNVDKPFDKFMKECSLDQLSLNTGMKMKTKHTLVDKWPLRLRMGAKQKEFDMLLASGQSGSERYVEWESLT